MGFKFSWVSFSKIILLLLLIAGIATACITLPVEKMLKDFLAWIEHDLGPWGPLVLFLFENSYWTRIFCFCYPVKLKPCGTWYIFQLGGGYLFGLPVGFFADLVGATVGAGAAFLLGRTIGRSFVISKLRDYPQFRAVAVAIQRSGFKIVLLLRLVPLLPFNMLNYLLSMTPVPIGQYMLATWLGMMPITLALVYVGTSLKDLSDVTHGWNEFSKTRWARALGCIFLFNFSLIGLLCLLWSRPFKRWKASIYVLTSSSIRQIPIVLILASSLMQAFIVLGFVVSVVLMICVTRVAKVALDKALAENVDLDGDISSPRLPIAADHDVNLHQPLIIKIDHPQDSHEK